MSADPSASFSLPDEALGPFFATRDRQVAGQLLETITSDTVKPVAESIVKSRLGWNPNRRNPTDEDEELSDVAQDAIAAVIEKLWDAWENPETKAIQNLRAYTSRVAVSQCSGYLRRKHSGHWRATGRLEWIADKNIGFSIWDTDSGRVFGFNPWRETKAKPNTSKLSTLTRDPNLAVREAESAFGRIADSLPRNLELLMNWLEGPVGVNVLAKAVSTLLKLDPPERYIANQESDAQDPVDQDVDIHRSSEVREELRFLWTEIQELPVQQRLALLLNLRDHQGRGVIAFLPIAKIASISTIGRVLEMTTESLLELWPKLPLDDTSIAVLLGVHRDKIPGLRSTARQRLLRKSKKEEF